MLAFCRLQVAFQLLQSLPHVSQLAEHRSRLCWPILGPLRSSAKHLITNASSAVTLSDAPLPAESLAPSFRLPLSSDKHPNCVPVCGMRCHQIVLEIGRFFQLAILACLSRKRSIICTLIAGNSASERSLSKQDLCAEADLTQKALNLNLSLRLKAPLHEEATCGRSPLPLAQITVPSLDNITPKLTRNNIWQELLACITCTNSATNHIR